MTNKMPRLYSNSPNATTIALRATSFTQDAVPGSQQKAGHLLIVMQKAESEVFS